MTSSTPQAELLALSDAVDSILPHWLDAGIAVLTRSGAILSASPPLLTWLNTTAETVTGQSLWSLLISREPSWREFLASIPKAAEPFLELVLPPPSAGSRSGFRLELTQFADHCYVRLSSVLPPLSELAEANWDAYLRSHSAHRDMFTRLVRAEAQLQDFMQRWPGVAFSQRADFSLRFATPSIEPLTGIPVADWERKPHLFWQILVESDVADLQSRIKSAVPKGQPLTSTFRIRHAQTGRVVYILEQRQPLVSQDGLVLSYECVWLDVTRQTLAEKRLAAAAWKESLATLTMGLAHDFTNLLAGMHSLSETFLSQIPSDHPFAEGLGLIRKSAIQSSQLVQRIIQLNRGKPGESNYHDLNEIVADALDLVRKIIPRRIQVEAQIAPGHLPIYVDAIELRQVIINMIFNAVDAMPGSGVLSLRTSAHSEFPGFGHVCGTPPAGPLACLELRDTGGGIKARHLNHIFEPFFTTKAIHKGSGLGLYNARLFLEKHHGAISVVSQENRGTTFFLWLPQADLNSASQLQLRLQAAVPQKRLCWLLVGQPGQSLEDTAEFLRTHNYFVVVTLSPDSALECLNSGDYEFHGLFVNAEPGGGFAELIPAARQLQPRLATVVKLIGSSSDDLDKRAAAQIDLILTADLPETDIAQQLELSLEQHGYRL